MKVYTYSRARENLATLLREAADEGGVRIRRRDGTLFEVAPVESGRSALDVPGLGTSITSAEIVSVVRQGRRRAAGPTPAKARKRRKALR